MFLNDLKNALTRWVIKKSFLRQCVIGDSFSVLQTARCYNFSSQKRRIVIGSNVELDCVLCVSGGGKITIGNNTTIRHHTELSSTCGISIGNDVIISNWCIISDNNNHPTSPKARREMTQNGFYGELWSNEKAESASIVIEENVWICQRVMIFKGVRIGRGSIIAAGSVVTHDIPEYCVAAGNPARIVKWLTRD